MGNYFLRTKREKGTASVYLRVQKRNPKLNILVCSKVSVDIQQWDKVTQDVAKWNDYCKTQDGRKVKETLDSISSAIDNLIWLRMSFSGKKESDNAFKKKKSDKSKKG